VTYHRVSRLREVADEAIKAELYRSLAATNGDIARAAMNLGTNRTYIYCLLKRYGIKIEREKRARLVERE
jgi:transcriptional regulator of acetoin/glycerol metabolism